MLTHTIIVEKPIIHLPAVHRPNNSFNGFGAGGTHFVKNILNQYELDVFLETKPVVGEILVLNSVHNVVNKLYQTHYVARIESDYQLLSWDGTGRAKTHFLMQMEDFTKPNPWHRWVDILDYRRITEAEREALGVELQNHIQRARAFVETHT